MTPFSKGRKTMNELQEKVLKTIKKHELVKNGDTILIGVSGGPDSVTLLHIMNELKNTLNIQIIVCHINHQIRKESTEEEQYVENLCKKMQIPIYKTRIKVQEKAQAEKIGLEEAGRKARYAFFKEIQQKTNAQKIATAHNANDNCETVLMNMIRGCGVPGLKGISIKRGKTYIKPLLETTREEIENYCQTYQLHPCIDKSNQENIYTRNKIRNILIPTLQKEYNPNIIKTINRLAELAEKETKYLQSVTENEYNQIVKEEKEQEIRLDAKKIQALENYSISKLILYSIEKLLGSTQGVEKIHIEDITKLIQNNKGNKFLTPNKHLKVTLKNKEVILQKM